MSNEKQIKKIKKNSKGEIGKLVKKDFQYSSNSSSALLKKNEIKFLLKYIS